MKDKKEYTEKQAVEAFESCVWGGWANQKDSSTNKKTFLRILRNKKKNANNKNNN